MMFPPPVWTPAILQELLQLVHTSDANLAEVQASVASVDALVDALLEEGGQTFEKMITTMCNELLLSSSSSSSSFLPPSDLTALTGLTYSPSACKLIMDQKSDELGIRLLVMLGSTYSALPSSSSSSSSFSSSPNPKIKQLIQIIVSRCIVFGVIKSTQGTEDDRLDLAMNVVRNFAESECGEVLTDVEEMCGKFGGNDLVEAVVVVEETKFGPDKIKGGRVLGADGKVVRNNKQRKAIVNNDGTVKADSDNAKAKQKNNEKGGEGLSKIDKRRKNQNKSKHFNQKEKATRKFGNPEAK
ncbi:hypothetical protein ScalyP_jg6702 [Parmales sp. scaly parma]|nr:hypothetical protein ScalyP_jg6702 [Parmales sp. scaly parma]